MSSHLDVDVIVFDVLVTMVDDGLGDLALALESREPS